MVETITYLQWRVLRLHQIPLECHLQLLEYCELPSFCLVIPWNYYEINERVHTHEQHCVILSRTFHKRFVSQSRVAYDFWYVSAHDSLGIQRTSLWKHTLSQGKSLSHQMTCPWMKQCCCAWANCWNEVINKNIPEYLLQYLKTDIDSMTFVQKVDNNSWEHRNFLMATATLMYSPFHTGTAIVGTLNILSVCTSRKVWQGFYFMGERDRQFKFTNVRQASRTIEDCQI